MGARDATKLGDSLPDQDMGIDGSGELHYALVLDRTGTEFTPAQNADSLPATTDPPEGRKSRGALSK